MSERKLATIRKIKEIKPIENADAIELAIVDGWQVVVKKNEYAVNDLVVYIEIDSWVPTELAPFLSKGKEPKEFNSIKGERLRTIKLRGQLSQGLLLPLNVLGESYETSTISIGADVTEQLGIQKWEKPIPTQLAGQVRGNFPSSIPKTDAIRIQNVQDWETLAKTHTFEITEKLHGSSCTFYLDNDNEFHVCSRNLDLKFDANNAYWKIALKYDIENRMKEHGFKGIAIQGELVGEGINGNQYKIDGLDFFVFSMYNENINGGCYVGSKVRTLWCDTLALKQVPEISEVLSGDIQEMLKKAEGKSCLNGSEREGLVLKSQDDTSMIVKVISNKWLLKGGEDQ